VSPTYLPGTPHGAQKEIFVEASHRVTNSPVGDHPRRQRGKSEAGSGSNPQEDLPGGGPVSAVPPEGHCPPDVGGVEARVYAMDRTLWAGFGEAMLKAPHAI